MIKERLIDYIEQSIRRNWNIEALSNYREKGYTYREIAEKILKLHIFFRRAGIAEGDKIALVGRNSANWCVVYLAVVTYGGVIVPVLPDFKPEDMTNIINHSDSKLLFVDDKIWENLDFSRVPHITSVISVDTFNLLVSRDPSLETSYRETDNEFRKFYPDFKPEDVKFSDVTNDKLAVISYTSGTTGFSKGVMLPHNSLAANVRFAQHHMPLDPGDPVVSFLPLAHTYGCAFEFLFPFT
ncbi:MAG TPA: AMP-binding protein, partial [Bacteroidales bacterium]|nr:AMP-binding protein [Bacteroidales bacterium]